MTPERQPEVKVGFSMQNMIDTSTLWQIDSALLPHTKEIHLAAGRNDFQGPFDSAQELRDIYSGERKTDITPMLETVRDFGWTGPIVTEIPATSAKDLISNSKFATPSMLVRVHSQIVENVKRITQPNKNR